MEELGRPVLQLVYMEQNRIADVLEKEGSRERCQDGEAIVLGVLPMFVIDVVRADIEGTFFCYEIDM